MERSQAAHSAAGQRGLTQVRISRAAELDLLEGYGFYAIRKAEAGEYFLDSLYAAIDSLAFYAGMHPKPFGLAHRMLATRFPYAIYYELRGTTATVIAVLDCRRNPAMIAGKLGQYRNETES